MAIHIRHKTTIIRLTTIILLSIAWVVSICTLILGFNGIAHSNANDTSQPDTSSSSGNDTIDATFDPDAAISKLGASIGLIGTIFTAIPLAYSVYRMIKPVRSSGISIVTGTLFNRWIGGLIWPYSSSIIAATAALTYERRALLSDSDVAISTLCFIIGTFTLMTSLLILIKPKKTVKQPPRRRYLTYEVHEGYYSPKSDQSHLSITITDGKDFINSPPHLDTPSIVRSHSVQRKRVDYFAYLFDDGTSTPTATDMGHQAYTNRPPFDISSGDYQDWKQSSIKNSTAHDTCSSSLNEVMLPSLNFIQDDSLKPPPKVKSSTCKPKMKRARIYDHKTGAIAMLPYESNCNSRVSL